MQNAQMQANLPGRFCLSDHESHPALSQKRSESGQRFETFLGALPEAVLVPETGSFLALRGRLAFPCIVCAVLRLLVFFATLALLRADAQTFVSGVEGFETGYDGWTTDNTNIWKVGSPAAAPGAAYAGTNCAGTGLTGNTPAWQSSHLISPVFAVPAASQNPRLRWWQWFVFGSDFQGTDDGQLQISTNNGVSWQTLAVYGGNSAGWSEPSVDLSAYAGQPVRVGFLFTSGDHAEGSTPGWFVDNVTLVTGAITTLTVNVPVDFESGLGDWSVDNGVWAVGSPTAGPGAAYAGTNCAGTGLTGNTPAWQSSHLISPVFAVPAASQNPRLRFTGDDRSTGRDHGRGHMGS